MKNSRMERIERLLSELQYEIETGMVQGEVEETLIMQWFVPLSKSIPDGVVRCRFETRPLPRHCMGSEYLEPRLKVVK
jgi:hypothetical protein